MQYFVKVLSILLLFSNICNGSWINDFISKVEMFRIKHLLLYELLDKTSYSKEPDQVRIGNKLSIEENNFINNRSKINSMALENFLGIKLSGAKLNIAFCTSGGGYRAMICTFGSLLGAQDTGLLDCITYMAGLSGSTWALSCYVYWLLNQESKLEDLIERISNNLANNKNNALGIPEITDHDQIKNFAKNLVIKYLFNQSISVIDIWGALIINNLLAPDKNRQNLKMSQATNIDKFKEGKIIFPIYTAVEATENSEYHWYEFTPYEVGNVDINAYINTQLFDNHFENGKIISQKVYLPNPLYPSHAYAPEQSLGFLLGIFGSAFEIDINDAIRLLGLKQKIQEVSKYITENLVDEIIKKINLDTLQTKIASGNITDARFFPAKVENFTYKIPNVPNTYQSEITLVDAGIDFNLPFPPLLRPEREIDIIIALDNSQPLDNASALKSAEKYANKHGLNFPKIDYTNIVENSITVFEQDNAPTVIYMPIIKDKKIKYPDKLANFDPEKCAESGPCSTVNFAYSKEDFDKLCTLTRVNMIENIEKIKETITRKIITKMKAC